MYLRTFVNRVGAVTRKPVTAPVARLIFRTLPRAAVAARDLGFESETLPIVFKAQVDTVLRADGASRATITTGEALRAMTIAHDLQGRQVSLRSMWGEVQHARIEPEAEHPPLPDFDSEPVRHVLFGTKATTVASEAFDRRMVQVCNAAFREAVDDGAVSRDLMRAEDYMKTLVNPEQIAMIGGWLTAMAVGSGAVIGLLSVLLRVLVDFWLSR